MSLTRKQYKKKRSGKILRNILLTLLTIIILGGSYYAYNIINSAKEASEKIYHELDSEKIRNVRTEKVEVTKDPFSLLLVGIENQEGGLGRSDVLMLITVNPQTEQIQLLSIPRDTRTYIPDGELETKINHSYGYGGIESTINTVNELLDIPIDYFVTTNFEGFEDVVDTLGGVTVNVPFTFEAQLTRSLKWKTYYEGPMDLNGNEALAYVRMRKSDPKGDLGRNERQQEVIKQIIDKGTSLSSISKIDDVLEDLGENVTTNIPPSKFMSFIKLYSQIKDNEIQKLTLEGYDKYIDNIYYYIPQEESIAQLNETLKNSLKTTNADTENSEKSENMSASESNKNKIDY